MPANGRWDLIRRLKVKSSGRTMALGATQLLTEMSTRAISWGIKAAGVKD